MTWMKGAILTNAAEQQLAAVKGKRSKCLTNYLMHAMFLSEQFKNRMAKAFIFISAVASLFMLVSNSLRGFPISVFISLLEIVLR